MSKSSQESFRDDEKDHLEAVQQLDNPRSPATAEIDSFIDDMERQLSDAGGLATGFFKVNFKNPRHFTWLLVAFASMGGLLSGLDQSLISGANLYLPDDLGIDQRQNSLVNAGMPLGAVGGALILSPTNEYFGRKWAILISIMLYTVGAALEAGSINFGMIVAARVILGLGVGLEGGTVPVYVAETVQRRIRGNLVSLYQFNIALGEVLGYAVAAIFLKVPGNWRYILGSSLLFSTIMFFGYVFFFSLASGSFFSRFNDFFQCLTGLRMLFLPESPRFLMHKNRPLDAYKVWKRIRGIEDAESREEFYIMTSSVRQEDAVVSEGAVNTRFPWMDFFTYVHSPLIPRCSLPPNKLVSLVLVALSYSPTL